MSGGVCEVVRAETVDLDRFVDHGDRFVVALQALFDEVAAARSRVVALMGAADVPAAGAAEPMAGNDPLAELIAEATVTGAFVGEISQALAAWGSSPGIGLVPADSIDAALALAGLDLTGTDRSLVVDQGRIDALAIRRELLAIVATGSGLPDHLQGHQIGVALEDHLGGLEAAELARVAPVLVDLGIDLQAGLDLDHGDGPGRRTAATMLVSQGLLLWPGDRAELVDDLAGRSVPTGLEESELALSLLVDALDLEQSNDDLTIYGIGFGPWQRANQPFVRQAVLAELIKATTAGDGTISPAGQRLVDDVLDRYPGVVELSATTWHDIDLRDRHQNTPDGRACRVWPTTALRAVLASALVAPNNGLDDATFEAALALDALDRRLASGVSTAAAESIDFEREVLIALLADGDPDRMVLIGQALAAGMPASDAVRLAGNASEPALTDARVRRLRLVYDTTPWGDPVPIDEVDPGALPPHVAATLAAELGVLQNVQLARFAEGRVVPEMPLSADQVDLVARYDEVATWFQHRFAWGWPGGAEGAVDHLRTLDEPELGKIFGDVPEGFAELLDELGRPENQIIWDLMAGASGNDTFLGPNGTFRPAGGNTVTSGDPEALLVQLALLREVGPYQELLDGDGSGVIHEDEVARWLEASRGDPSIPPALVDRVAIGAGFGLGEDTFGWDEIAAIIGVVGLAAAIVVTTVYSGGAAVPYWVQGGLVGLAALEGYAAHRSGDGLGATLAFAGGAADVVAAWRLLRITRTVDAETHARLLTLAERSDIPAIRALAGEADRLSAARFAGRYREILDDLGYDPFLDAIATRDIGQQVEIVANIERLDRRFLPMGQADPKTGHAATRHGPHVGDDALFARANDLGQPVSRWTDWTALERSIDEATLAMTDASYILATRGTDACPIIARGWKQIDQGNLTIDDIMTDPANAHWRRKTVQYDGSSTGSGVRFDPDGTTTTVDDGFRVVLKLDAAGDYHTLTAYPTP